MRTLSNEISIKTCCRLMRFVEKMPASEIGFGSKPKNLYILLALNTDHWDTRLKELDP